MNVNRIMIQYHLKIAFVVFSCTYLVMSHEYLCFFARYSCGIAQILKVNKII